ncbi:PREDICTED: elongation of very long chain fatty acids protein 1-like [Polistes canadensis]|uniref:elongation of very long chain fatty acids protein 1-like n=1 Tax=Polistes canadensis TaxID=91411 RepID=UPI000718E5B7|nr:PREDICTED: elongation of very long chain fatty acids protein 1-like [Polistes canadensis]
MNFTKLYNSLSENLDQRVKSWPIVDTSTIPIILLIYVIFLYVAPKYMENRLAYSLKTFIQCYNLFQIIANSIVVYMFLDAGWLQDIFFYCVPMLYNTDHKSMQIATAIWYTLLLKVIDLIETGVFVLRKKNRQISVLHIYHHISTVLLTWNVQKLINPYKSILTTIQMVQLVIIILYIFSIIISNCDIPKIQAYIYLLNVLINLVLFLNFYQKNYVISKGKNK